MLRNELIGRLRAVPPGRRLITALDVPDTAAALALAGRLGPRGGFVKVGLELFSAGGPEVVTALRGLGRDVFLDLKYHDIPNTVASAARHAARLGASLGTIPAANGPAARASAAPTRIRRRHTVRGSRSSAATSSAIDAKRSLGAVAVARARITAIHAGTLPLGPSASRSDTPNAY